VYIYLSGIVLDICYIIVGYFFPTTKSINTVTYIHIANNGIAGGGFFMDEKIGKRKRYRGISISEELAERIKTLVEGGQLGYNSSTDFITEAIRMHLDHMEQKNQQLKKLKKELKED